MIWILLKVELGNFQIGIGSVPLRDPVATQEVRAVESEGQSRTPVVSGNTIMYPKERSQVAA